MQDDNQPHYPHDCDRCTFLGRSGTHDLYHCEQVGGLNTVIARYGAEGPAYKSGLPLAEHDPDLREAKRRAAALGLPLD